ncbi:DNA gyrase subunit A [Candidatus Jidaibacter acanthamoeba]|uniref:DNA gyrase subunit A n=1 Tax=Candidatus Jidaibacter acanthamoebae TaxID=86105 RepID=A0A0C1QHL9_9RICK|nr:DNA gyrase subunit A [Candidatus Jidaibacter acanthamoeba]KIE04999.1 DNA gyrase subunit A [Candidatus Jidaibacter acanthamoeba]
MSKGENLNLEFFNVLPVKIEDEMRKSYLDYAMSVIVSRALPDARDGLKPVHRRILFSMYEMSNFHDKPYKKSARIVGDVIGKYHPHGNDSIYLALVRMAQDFSLRIPLIDGQGNFGSMDGDSPAQMRYTEVRLAKISSAILNDIDKGTVDFQDNYDGSEKEPRVLPTRFPNLLVNGTNGIAVGMATNIPTHNLGEVIDACCAYIENPEITAEELTAYVPGPDFPTGGLILGREKAKKALMTGRGSVIVRGKTEFEEIGGRQAIIINEIPYQVNKAELVKHIEHLTKEKIIEGIYELRDESNKLGVRVVIELKKDVVSNVILKQLYKFTELQSSFAYNTLALNKGIPIVMSIRDIIAAFVEFREEVVARRTSFLLSKARDKAHVLIGLYLAVSNIDEVIALIKASPDAAAAKVRLMERSWQAQMVESLLSLVDDYRNNLVNGTCYFTEEQAKAILEMRLQRLTGLEKEKIENELKELAAEIKEYLSILSSREKLYAIILTELAEVKQQFATPRKTDFELNEAEVDIEDLIQKEEMVVTLTLTGYVKRVPLNAYRSQKRGGKGRSALSMHDEDLTTDIIASNTHTTLLFFSDIGKVYKTKVYQLPLGTPQSKGRALVNLFPLSDGEKINNIMAFPEDKSTWDQLNIMFSTSNGNIRRNSLLDFVNIQSNGKIAIKLDDNDKLIGVAVCESHDHMLLSTRMGKSIRFPVDSVRVFKSRSSDGVRGIRLAREGDAVISLSVLKGAEIGMEKRDEFLKISENIRMMIAANPEDQSAINKLNRYTFEKLTKEEAVELAKNEEYILAITENGYGKRTSAYEYRITDRGGQGVLNINTSKRNGSVVASFPVHEDEQIILITNRGTLIRTRVHDIRITGRNAMGVKIFDVKEAEKVISVTRVYEAEEEAEIIAEAVSGNVNADGSSDSAPLLITE